MKTLKQFITENNTKNTTALAVRSTLPTTYVNRFAMIARKGGKFGKLAAAGVTAASMALAGCATTPEQRLGGYYWVPNPAAPVCTDVIWKQVAADRIPGLCDNLKTSSKDGMSCAIGDCMVISPYSEVEAMSIKMSRNDNDTLWKHERRHVLDRLKHPNNESCEILVDKKPLSEFIKENNKK